jgi:predicted PurR-regulated permease PerM
MDLLDTRRHRAAALVILLGIGLLVALAPYASGLIGALVLYVVFQPLHAWLAQRINSSVSAGIVVLLVLVLIVLPSTFIVILLLDQAQSLASSVMQSSLLARLSSITIGTLDIGSQIAKAGEQVVSWMGQSAIKLLGSVTRMLLNLTIALFCLYYLLLQPTGISNRIVRYFPFSPDSLDRLRMRFQDVTRSTIIGTGVTALIQGALVGLGFWMTGISNALFWSVVTVVFAILPVVGSGLVWGPAAVSLALDDRYAAAIGLVLLGVIAVGNVDLVVRPLIFRRWAQIHPLTTIVGAIGGVAYFGLLGLLIGPLALSYFFELLEMYEQEYLQNDYPDSDRRAP